MPATYPASYVSYSSSIDFMETIYLAVLMFVLSEICTLKMPSEGASFIQVTVFILFSSRNLWADFSRIILFNYFSFPEVKGSVISIEGTSRVFEVFFM